MLAHTSGKQQHDWSQLLVMASQHIKVAGPSRECAALQINSSQLLAVLVMSELHTNAVHASQLCRHALQSGASSKVDVRQCLPYCLQPSQEPGMLCRPQHVSLCTFCIEFEFEVDVWGQIDAT